MDKNAFDAIMASKERELEELERQGREAGFAPRKSLMRTPPPRDTSVRPREDGARKRKGTSPLELEEATRRRVCQVRTPGSASPRAETGPTAELPREPDTNAPTTVGKYVAEANSAGEAIMAATSASTSKLNKLEIAQIGTQVQKLTGIIALLSAQLGEERLKICALEHGARSGRQEEGTTPKESANSYANALNTGRGPKPKPSSAGTVLAFYPAAEKSEEIKTADQTKAALKKALDPQTLGVGIAQVRKIGNAGVIVQAASKGDADKIRRAVPDNLRVQVPKPRAPLVAVVAVDGARVDSGAFLRALRTQNFAGQQEWRKEEVDVAFKKSARGGACTTVVLRCSPAWRDKLVSKERVYIEWERHVVRDYADATCCGKCQGYGHAARFCRATVDTCGNCGEDGHTHKACKNTFRRCATCKKAGKPSEDHRTASVQCPARQAAEKRSLERTNYGL
ncbi:unnamed protein product [Pieris brassicae]|uniref:CCHC-type domain-containing protein n=1 Tax=Pieris brassicae TaxID=7116 RepID=A0A9P0TSC2_PIEBR|nr:unnamed protein product [Pieris brassicae]